MLTQILEYSDAQDRDQNGMWTQGGSVQVGSRKTTVYTNNNTRQQVSVEHNSQPKDGEAPVMVSHLDARGDILNRTRHDSVASARQHLQTQGIQHKFYGGSA